VPGALGSLWSKLRGLCVGVAVPVRKESRKGTVACEVVLGALCGVATRRSPTRRKKHHQRHDAWQQSPIKPSREHTNAPSTSSVPVHDCLGDGAEGRHEGVAPMGRGRRSCFWIGWSICARLDTPRRRGRLPMVARSTIAVDVHPERRVRRSWPAAAAALTPGFARRRKRFQKPPPLHAG
jgi:hypothetical protein